MTPTASVNFIGRKQMCECKTKSRATGRRYLGYDSCRLCSKLITSTHAVELARKREDAEERTVGRVGGILKKAIVDRRLTP